MKQTRIFVKFVIILVIAVMCGCSAGCSLISDKRFDDIRFHRHYTTMCDEIIEALDHHDEASLKRLFFDNTVDQVVDIDTKIKEFMEFYKGESIHYETISGLEQGMLGDYFEQYIYFKKNGRNSTLESFARIVITKRAERGTVSRLFFL